MVNKLDIDNIKMHGTNVGEKKTHVLIGLRFEEETSEMLRLEHGSVWC